MHYIAELEMERFEEDFKIGLSQEKSNNYLDVHDYEDEFSHNEVSEAQHQLKKEIEAFLEKRNITNYKVYYDWCVHVIDKSLYENLTS